VLNNMVAAGMIDAKTAESAALTGAAQLVKRAPPAGHYFADWIKSTLDGMAEIQGKDIVVKTTLDLRLERAAEHALESTLEAQGEKSNVSQGAVVVLGLDGSVRALVGGKDYDDSQFNRATQALRQPGSSFKPFVYLAGMEYGLSPEDTMEDAPISLGGWSPGNYNGKFEGTTTLRHAFAQSTNTVAVRVIEKVGPNRVIEAAHRLGITSDLRSDASLALGTSEATPLEMTTAYTPFANGGEGVTAFGITEIDDNRGNVLFKREGGGLGRVIAPEALAKMHTLMSAVITEGTGKGAKLDRPVAGKTGTTQDYRDAWFLGFTSDYVAGVWLGNDDQRNAMKKVTGGGLPAQIWKQVMVEASRGLPIRPLVMPVTVEAESNGFGQTLDSATEAVKDVGNSIGGLINSLFGR
jgi:penicillin-binding protein 1A